MVFDMDGVIVDSTAVHTEAWRRYLEQQGVEAADIGPRMLGKHNADIVWDLFGPGVLTEEAVAEHGRRKERLYREMMDPELPRLLVPGILEFLERHRNVPMALASNAEPENVEFVLDRAGIRERFRVIINGHEVQRPKPDPEIYVTAAARLRVAPANCVVFEDSHTGIAAARAAGAKVVGVTTTMSEFPIIDLSIRDFHDPDLEKWLRNTLSAV